VGIVARRTGDDRWFEVEANWLTAAQQSAWDSFVEGVDSEGGRGVELGTGRLAPLRLTFCGGCAIRLSDLLSRQIVAFDALAEKQSA
jgi:hypothetical protein